MTTTIELCAGVTLETDHEWVSQDHGTPAHYHPTESRLYVNGEEVEIEGIMEQMLSDQFGRHNSKLNETLELALEGAGDE